jgi:hypothetical protein
VLRKELKLKAKREGVAPTLRCGPYEILRVAAAMHRRVVDMNDSKQQLVLCGLRRNLMLSYRPGPGGTGGTMVRSDSQLWARAMPEGSHRLKPEWYEDRYKWRGSDGVPVPLPVQAGGNAALPQPDDDDLEEDFLGGDDEGRGLVIDADEQGLVLTDLEKVALLHPKRRRELAGLPVGMSQQGPRKPAKRPKRGLKKAMLRKRMVRSVRRQVQKFGIAGAEQALVGWCRGAISFDPPRYSRFRPDWVGWALLGPRLRADSGQIRSRVFPYLFPSVPLSAPECSFICSQSAPKSGQCALIAALTKICYCIIARFSKVNVDCCRQSMVLSHRW